MKNKNKYKNQTNKQKNPKKTTQEQNNKINKIGTLSEQFQIQNI